MIPEQAKRLTKIAGISTLTAGTIYTEIKGKKMTKSQFASYCGVAPVDCSSGMSNRHRNNHRGNRILNSILYSVAIHQIQFDEIGSKYYLKKLQEGKAKKLLANTCKDDFLTSFEKLFFRVICIYFLKISRNIY